MVRCPCHNDSTQSLSISEQNVKILLNCFACAGQRTSYIQLVLEWKIYLRTSRDVQCKSRWVLNIFTWTGSRKSDITFKKMVSGKSRSVGNTRTKAKMAKRQEKWHSSAVQAEFTFRRSDWWNGVYCREWKRLRHYDRQAAFWAVSAPNGARKGNTIKFKITKNTYVLSKIIIPLYENLFCKYPILYNFIYLFKLWVMSNEFAS